MEESVTFSHCLMLQNSEALATTSYWQFYSLRKIKINDETKEIDTGLKSQSFVEVSFTHATYLLHVVQVVHVVHVLNVPNIVHGIGRLEHIYLEQVLPEISLTSMRVPDQWTTRSVVDYRASVLRKELLFVKLKLWACRVLAGRRQSTPSNTNEI
jgi:hypothetical protein